MAFWTSFDPTVCNAIIPFTKIIAFVKECHYSNGRRTLVRVLGFTGCDG
jgi:hypothetical protein